MSLAARATDSKVLHSPSPQSQLAFKGASLQQLLTNTLLPVQAFKHRDKQARLCSLRIFLLATGLDTG